MEFYCKKCQREFEGYTDFFEHAVFDHKAEAVKVTLEVLESKVKKNET